MIFILTRVNTDILRGKVRVSRRIEKDLAHSFKNTFCYAKFQIKNLGSFLPFCDMITKKKLSYITCLPNGWVSHMMGWANKLIILYGQVYCADFV